ncbi:aspartyl-phosphate phosphatase Spo0E family protein [Paenibacillus xerothermodurans]|uniref:Aspartyl-phosphate phosphatase Spo0E family protein n=1 Tax=Paenibacillus xerothermodurans TaxID=1977292 RepID=A0A2W1P3V3_PAEXE|nr:aspartyl-phosphate phosphatase Spo0E family protein [Paenibacillus xerothermodurans]
MQFESAIYNHVQELQRLISAQGKALTEPEVAATSMELDLLILTAMRSQKKAFCKTKLLK